MTISQQLKQQFAFLNNAATNTLSPSEMAELQKAYGVEQSKPRQLSERERAANLEAFNTRLTTEASEMGKAFITNTATLPAEARYRAWQQSQEAVKSRYAHLSEEQQQAALTAFNEHADVFRLADKEAGFFARTGDALSYIPTSLTKLGEQATGLIAPESEARKWFADATQEVESWRSDEAKMRALRASDAMAEAKKRGESGFSQFFANAKDNPLEAVGQFTESALPTIGAAVAGAAAAPFTGGASLALPFVVGGVQGAGETRNEIYDHIMAMPQAQLSQSPEYQALLAKGLSEQKARQALASSITEHGGEVLATGLSSAALSQLGGLGRIGQVGKGVMGSTAGKFASEVITEPVDEVFQQWIGNKAINDIDPTHSLTEGLGEAAAGGLLFGAAGGAMAAADNAYRKSKSAPAQPESDKTIDELTQATPAQTQPTQSQPQATVNEKVLENVLADYKAQTEEAAYNEMYEELKADIAEGNIHARAADDNGDTQYRDFARAYLAQTGQTPAPPTQAVETEPDVANKAMPNSAVNPDIERALELRKRMLNWREGGKVGKIDDLIDGNKVFENEDVKRDFALQRAYQEIKQTAEKNGIDPNDNVAMKTWLDDYVANRKNAAVQAKQNREENYRQQYDAFLGRETVPSKQKKSKTNSVPEVQQEQAQTTMQSDENTSIQDDLDPVEYEDLSHLPDFQHNNERVWRGQKNGQPFRSEQEAEQSDVFKKAEEYRLNPTVVDKDGAFLVEIDKTEDVRFSRSPIKSVEANIKRGRERMTQAILNKADVKRGMYNSEFGWVDFVWGDDGLTKPFNKKGEPRGRGIAHIFEARERKDGQNHQQTSEMLVNDIVNTIAKGSIVTKTSHRMVLEYKENQNDLGHRAILTKDRSHNSNSWLLTGFENDPSKGRKANSNGERTVGYGTSTPTQTTPMRSRDNLGALEMHQPMNQSGGATTSDLRTNSPIRSRTEMGAAGTDNVQQTAPQRNSQTQTDQQALSRILGEEIASHIEVVDRNTVKPPKGQTIESLKNVEGWYERSTQKAYIYSDGITEAFGLTREERLAWVAWHELAHKGLNVKYGNTLKSALQQARKHPVVGVISHRIQQRNPSYSEEVAIEEALVELYSAYQTDNWASLNRRYQTRINPGYALKGKYDMGNVFQRFAAVIKRLIAALSKNKRAEMMSEQALFDLIKGVDESVKELESSKPNSNEDTEEGVLFSVYSDDADKIDRAVSKMGLTSRRDSSRVSASEYVIIFDENNEEVEDFKIRVSNHTLPSGYEQANFEVQAKGAKQSKGVTDGSWADAVAAVAKHFGKEIPANVKRFTTQALAETAQARREAFVNKVAQERAEKAQRVAHLLESEIQPLSYDILNWVARSLRDYRRKFNEFKKLEKEGGLGYRTTKKGRAYFILPSGREVSVYDYFPMGAVKPTSIEDYKQRMAELLDKAEQLKALEEAEKEKAKQLRALKKAEKEERKNKKERLELLESIAPHFSGDRLLEIQEEIEQIKAWLKADKQAEDESDVRYSLNEDPHSEFVDAIPKRTANSYDEAREVVTELLGEPLVNRETGMIATISKRSLDKLVSGKAAQQSSSIPDHLTAVANIDQLFKNAIAGWVENPKNVSDVTTAGVHKMFAPLQVGDGSIKLVKLTVKEFKDNSGNRIYSVETIEVGDQNSPVPELMASVQSEQTHIGLHRANVESLIQRIKNFNSQAKNTSEQDTNIRFSRRSKSESLEKLREAEPIRISGKEIEPSTDLREYKRNALNYGKTLRGTYVNKDTGQEISIGRAGIQEILRHDYKDPDHLQSIAAIPQIIENAIYIDTLPNEELDKNPDIQEYEYYLAELNIAGNDYVVRAVVGASRKNGERYYDHKLTPINKNELLSLSYRVSTAGLSENNSLSGIDDKRLLHILQDENATAEDEESIRFSRKQSVADLIKTGKAKDDSTTLTQEVIDRDVSALKSRFHRGMAKLDEVLADSLRPVSDWIDSLDTLPTHIRARIKGRMYRAKTMRNVVRSEFEKRHMRQIIRMLSNLAKAHKKDPLTVKRLVGFYASLRYSIIKNEALLEQDRLDMVAAEQALNEAKANGEPIDALSRAYRRAERQYRYRKHDVELPAHSTAEFKVGTAGGWSIAEAKHYMAGIEKHLPKKKMEAVLRRLSEMQKALLELDAKSGRYTPEQIAEYMADEFYVPLTGDPNMEDVDNFIGGTGSRSLNISRDKALKGRKLSEAEDAFDAVWKAVGKTTTFYGWQPFKQDFYDMFHARVETLQAGGLSEKSAKAQAEAELGFSVQKMQGMTRSSDNVLIHKELGQYYEIALPKEMVQILKDDHVERAAAWTKFVSVPTRMMARGVTQLTYDFAPKNMLRDTWDKADMIRDKAIFDKNGNPLSQEAKNKIGRAVWHNMASKEVWKATNKYARGAVLDPHSANHAERVMAEFVKYGGLSSFTQNIAQTESDFIKQVKGASSKAKVMVEHLAGYVEAYNGTFDYVSSLATAKALVDNGVEMEQAASLVLDLANFNKTGAKMRDVKGFFMFLQPKMMGAAALLRSLNTRSGQRRFAAQFVTGLVLYQALAMAFSSLFDDEESGNKLDALGDITGFIPIPLPWADKESAHKYLKLHLGFGSAQLAWNMAVNISRAARNAISYTDAAVNIMTNWGKVFAPVSPSEVSAAKDPVAKAVLTAMPSLFQPIVQLGFNRNAFGSPIHTTFENDGKLKIDQARANTAKEWETLAQGVYDATGGLMDAYPESYKHMVEGYTLPLGSIREALNIFIENPNRERLGKTERPVLMRSLVGNTNEFDIQRDFFQAIQESKGTYKAYQHFKENGTLAEWQTPEKMQAVRFYEWADKEERTLKADKAKRTIALKKGTMSETAYDDWIKNSYTPKTEMFQRRAVYRWRTEQGLDSTKTH